MHVNDDALPGAGHPSFLINGTHHRRAYEDLMGDLETSTRALERLCDVFHLGLTVNPDVNPLDQLIPTSVQIEVRVPQQCQSDARMTRAIEHIQNIFVQEIALPAILFRNNQCMNVTPGRGVAATPRGTAAIEVRVGGSNPHHQQHSVLAPSRDSQDMTSPHHGTSNAPTSPTSPSPYPSTPPRQYGASRHPMLYNSPQTPLSQRWGTDPDSPSPVPASGAPCRRNSSGELWHAVGDLPGVPSMDAASPSLPQHSFQPPTPPPPLLTVPLSLTPFKVSPATSQLTIDPLSMSVPCGLFSRASCLTRQAYTAPEELMLGDDLQNVLVKLRVPPIVWHIVANCVGCHIGFEHVHWRYLLHQCDIADDDIGWLVAIMKQEVQNILR
ncbi:hypothetical protein K439DRAFT_1610394 [Ramaria rubella]|nr:hypothetical protein K439DRAFT_1610394 [Ramaria rubella]